MTVIKIFYIPAKCCIQATNGLRHDILGITANLEMIPVYHDGQVIQFVFMGKS